jgi:hypothetical protein
MKETAKPRKPVPASEPRRRSQPKPDLARCEVRTRAAMKTTPSIPGHEEPHALPDDWELPVLRAGGTWVGGSLRREDIYDDDGR